MKKYFQIEYKWILLLLILVEFGFHYFLNQWIQSEEVLYNSLSTELTFEQIQQGQAIAKSLAWLYYLVVPLTVILPILAIAFSLNIGMLLRRITIPFKQILSIVTHAYVVFAFQHVLMIALFSIYGIREFSDFGEVPSFSVRDFLSDQALDSWIAFPMKLLNLFQLFFLIIAAQGFKLTFGKSFGSWFAFLALVYGILIGIVILFMFFNGLL